MRVLYVGPAHTPFLRDCLAPFLADPSVEAALVSATPPPDGWLAANPRLAFHLLPRPSLRRLPRRLFVHTLDYLVETWDLALRRFRPDVLHLFYVSQLDALALAPLTLLPRRPPIVLTVYGADVLEDQVPLAFPLDRVVRRLFRGAEATTAKSRFLAGRCEALGARPERVRLVPWGLPRGLFVPGDRAAAREALGLPRDERLLLSTRTLAPLYNHDAVVEALAGQDARVVFTRASAEPAYAERVLARARDLGVRTTLLDPLPVARMPLLYAAGDAVVSIPSSDGLPQTLLEALCCERPTVTLDLEAYDELPFATDAHVHATLDALAPALKAALDPRPRPGLAAARAWIEREMDFDRSVEAIRALYARLS
jgi:glycosyltransferase involved in cell wall biosynthesis